MLRPRTLILVLLLTLLVALTPNPFLRALRGLPKLTPSLARIRPSPPIQRPLTTMAPPQAPNTIIIVGTGLAALSAARAIVESPLTSSSSPHVLLLERAAKPGGNSIKASSGINGAPTRHQPQPDSAEGFFEDSWRSVGAAVDDADSDALSPARRRELVHLLTGRSADAVAWLESAGVDLSQVALLGGHSVPRTHRPAGKSPVGFATISALLGQLKGRDGVEIRTNAEVTDLLGDGRGGVIGVRYRALAASAASGGDAPASAEEGEEIEVEGLVVMAAGGFAGDGAGELARYRPDLAGLPSTNEARPGPHALLTPFGARLVDMPHVQVHPTGFVDPRAPLAPVKFLAAEYLRGEGGILLRAGRRFADELATRKALSARVMAGPLVGAELDEGRRQWDVSLVLDEATYAATRAHVDFYIAKGLMRRCTIKDVDDPSATLEGLRDYAAAVVAGNDPLGRRDFGRWALVEPTLDSVLYVGRVTPVTHFTMGGVVVDDKARVLGGLGPDPVPVPGLWAAGEVVGGVHGENRLGGSSLLECVVFGRLAGESVVKAWGEGRKGGL